MHRLMLPSNRLSVGDEFQQLSQSLHLERLDFQISPETMVPVSHSHEVITESTVELKFTHSADPPLFHLIHHLIHDFPGLVMPTEITMWREARQSKPLIQGRFKFDWLKANSVETL